MMEMFCVLTVNISILVLYCAIVLQDVTIGRDWVKDTLLLC